MARFNEILAARFNRALQKLLSMKGGPPAPQLATEIGVAFQPPSGVEDDVLWGFDKFGGTGTTAGAVGAVSVIQVRNPSRSGVVARVVRSLPINGSATDTNMTLHILPDSGTDQASVATTFAWDTRGRKGSTCILSAGTTAVGSGQILAFGFVGGGSGDLWFGDRDLYLPLLPGKMLVIKGSVNNNALTCSFWWLERALEDSELT